MAEGDIDIDVGDPPGSDGITDSSAYGDIPEEDVVGYASFDDLPEEQGFGSAVLDGLITGGPKGAVVAAISHGLQNIDLGFGRDLTDQEKADFAADVEASALAGEGVEAVFEKYGLSGISDEQYQDLVGRLEALEAGNAPLAQWEQTLKDAIGAPPDYGAIKSDYGALGGRYEGIMSEYGKPGAVTQQAIDSATGLLSTIKTTMDKLDLVVDLSGTLSPEQKNLVNTIRNNSIQELKTSLAEVSDDTLQKSLANMAAKGILAHGTQESSLFTKAVGEVAQEQSKALTSGYLGIESTYAGMTSDIMQKNISAGLQKFGTEAQLYQGLAGIGGKLIENIGDWGTTATGQQLAAEQAELSALSDWEQSLLAAESKFDTSMLSALSGNYQAGLAAATDLATSHLESETERYKAEQVKEGMQSQAAWGAGGDIVGGIMDIWGSVSEWGD